MVEYSFLKDIHLQAASNNKDLIISRSDFDAFGFDVILGVDNKIVFVQLKAFNGKAAVWDVHKSLVKSNNGHVVIGNVMNEDGAIKINYFMLSNENRKRVYERAPKKEKDGRCKVNKGDLEIINNNLLKIFEDIPNDTLPE